MVINVNETDKHNYIRVTHSLFNVHIGIIYAMGGKLTWMKHYQSQWSYTHPEEPGPHPRNYFYKIHFNIKHHRRLGNQSGHFRSHCRTNFSTLPFMLHTPLILSSVALIMFSEDEKLWSFSLESILCRTLLSCIPNYWTGLHGGSALKC
jgi:hypothetical protein